MNIPPLKALLVIVAVSLFAACDGSSKEPNSAAAEISMPSIEKNLPIFMHNAANTVLYDQAAISGKVVARLTEESSLSLICVSAVQDAENKLWYKCYYPSEQVEGWTHQTSDAALQDEEIDQPFLQNFAQAQLQLGATPREAKRLLGQPLFESIEEGPVEVSGYTDSETTVTTTLLRFAGVQLTYEDDRMIHASINQPNKSFGWITCGDQNVTKKSVLKRFNLTEDDIYINDAGEQSVVMGGFLSVSVVFDKDEQVKTIEFNAGP